MKVIFGAHQDWKTGLRSGTEAAGHEFHMDTLGGLDLAAYDLVVPLRLDDRAALAPRIARGEAIPALLASAEAEALCHDKLAFNNAMIRAGLGACIPPMFSSWPADPDAYPVILKQRRDDWGKNSCIVPARPAPCHEIDHDTQFAQAYLPGTEEWATHLLLRDGRILFEASIRYTMPDIPCVKGAQTPPLGRQWQGQTEHLDLFRRVLDAAGFRDGTCCIDYRIGRDQVHIFEVNPRFGGSLCDRIGSYLEAYKNTLAAPQRPHCALPPDV